MRGSALSDRYETGLRHDMEKHKVSTHNVPDEDEPIREQSYGNW